MKNHLVQVLLSSILTPVSLFIGLFLSIETPVKTTEGYVVLLVLALNGLWFVPYLIHYYKRGKKLETILASLIFATNAVPFVLIWSHAPSFDSEVWKNSINENRSYGGFLPMQKGKW